MAIKGHVQMAASGQIRLSADSHSQHWVSLVTTERHQRVQPAGLDAQPRPTVRLPWATPTLHSEDTTATTATGACGSDGTQNCPSAG